MTDLHHLLTGPELSDTGVSAVGTMLIIAGVALVLGVLALVVARRRKDDHHP